MIKPKFEDFDYGEGRKDLSWCQYAKALEEYVTWLEAQIQASHIHDAVWQSEQLVCDRCKEQEKQEPTDPYCMECKIEIEQQAN